jgi:hypothetical protein
MLISGFTSQAVSRRPLTAKAWFRFPVRTVWFVVDKGTLGQVSLPPLQFPLPVPFLQCYVLLFIYTLSLPEGQRLNPGNRQKSGSIGYKATVTPFCSLKVNMSTFVTYSDGTQRWVSTCSQWNTATCDRLVSCTDRSRARGL